MASGRRTIGGSRLRTVRGCAGYRRLMKSVRAVFESCLTSAGLLRLCAEGVGLPQGCSAAASVRVSVAGDGFAQRWAIARSVRSEFLWPANQAGRGR